MQNQEGNQQNKPQESAPFNIQPPVKTGQNFFTPQTVEAKPNQNTGFPFGQNTTTNPSNNQTSFGFPSTNNDQKPPAFPPGNQNQANNQSNGPSSFFNQSKPATTQDPSVLPKATFSNNLFSTNAPQTTQLNSSPVENKDKMTRNMTFGNNDEMHNQNKPEETNIQNKFLFLQKPNESEKPQQQPLPSPGNGFFGSKTSSDKPITNPISTSQNPVTSQIDGQTPGISSGIFKMNENKPATTELPQNSFNQTFGKSDGLNQKSNLQAFSTTTNSTPQQTNLTNILENKSNPTSNIFSNQESSKVDQNTSKPPGPFDFKNIPGDNKSQQLVNPSFPQSNPTAPIFTAAKFGQGDKPGLTTADTTQQVIPTQPAETTNLLERNQEKSMLISS
jgi:hypothetical protein